MSDKNGMPSKGGFAVVMILGYLLGIIWGILSTGPFIKMNAAISAGDADAAWMNANKIRKWFFTGAGVNVCMILFMMCSMNRG